MFAEKTSKTSPTRKTFFYFSLQVAYPDRIFWCEKAVEILTLGHLYSGGENFCDTIPLH
jgi:hypothetical protein